MVGPGRHQEHRLVSRHQHRVVGIQVTRQCRRSGHHDAFIEPSPQLFQMVETTRTEGQGGDGEEVTGHPRGTSAVYWRRLPTRWLVPFERAFYSLLHLLGGRHRWHKRKRSPCLPPLATHPSALPFNLLAAVATAAHVFCPHNSRPSFSYFYVCNSC